MVAFLFIRHVLNDYIDKILFLKDYIKHNKLLCLFWNSAQNQRREVTNPELSNNVLLFPLSVLHAAYDIRWTYYSSMISHEFVEGTDQIV